MERLTKPTARKTGNKYVSAIGSGHGAWPRIIQRLAAYENTGLEPEEIESPVAHGYWFILEYEYFNCSVCGDRCFTDANSTAEAESFLENGDYYSYCPHCGAKMDLKGV